MMRLIVNNDQRAAHDQHAMISFHPIGDHPMSAMKDFQIDCEDKCDGVYEINYRASYHLMVLANLAWHNGTSQPIWAPELEWIEENRTLLKEALEALNELETAREVLDLCSLESVLS
jgi:hypothetical protein